MAALRMLEETCCGGVLVTGLIYINKEQPPLDQISNLVETPLSHLTEAELRPSRESLQNLLEGYR
jgi:hypothetical protein